MGLLNKIDTPEDLKTLTVDELVELAAELREFVINSVSETGGHLAPSLGVVELTLAIHYAFDAPRDKIVWDVGHQAYVHKIITGRRDRFGTLRQKGGISGFPKRSESEYDAYGVGHASTSISAALGMAVARDLNGEDYRVVAVIGDGAMSGGAALEGLNMAGHRDKTDLLVVLNDNEMSISPSVGAISGYLSRVFVNPPYNKFRREVQELVKAIPAYGGQLFAAARRVEEAVKTVLTPGMLFEALGFRYVGPIDGHDLPELVRQVGNARTLPGPTLLHVITKKGKGYTPAENDATTFHGLSSFEVSTGKAKKYGKGPPSYTSVFSGAMLELAGADEDIVAITAAMPEGTGLDAFRREFPDRFFDVGIAEQTAVLLAAGMVTEGLRPVAAIYSTFLQRAYDQLNHDVALQNLPIAFAMDRGGVVGDDGPTHHGTFDLSYLRHLPGFIVSAPKDENELRRLLYSAVYYDDGPWAVRYPRGEGEGVKLEPGFEPLEPGKAELLAEGTDVLVIGIGKTVYPAFRTAEALASDGISAAVINARFVRPLDETLIAEWAKKCGKILTVEDNVVAGGFGSALLEFFNAEGLLNGVKFRSLGYPDVYVEHATQAEIFKDYRLDADGIAEVAKEMLG
ncbi:MAG: 1-deoxy-D-xylulose-5-phosphate synthase [Candidatus Coatesbacteria bacterium]|nr:MAG: 1-deoxy-D-xylulose-5-phosphate synthase [Candidatus Coatesbacteria bacterium]